MLKFVEVIFVGIVFFQALFVETGFVKLLFVRKFFFFIVSWHITTESLILLAYLPFLQLLFA